MEYDSTVVTLYRDRLLDFLDNKKNVNILSLNVVSNFISQNTSMLNNIQFRNVTFRNLNTDLVSKLGFSFLNFRLTFKLR